MTKYRIVEQTHRSGEVEFIPQYRFLWGWWLSYRSDYRTQSFPTLQEAKDFIQKLKQIEAELEENRKASEVVSQKIHEV